MTENTREVELKATMDATGVRAGVEQAKTALGDLGRTAEREGTKAGAGVEKAGDGAGKAATKIERETRSMIASIERATAAFKAGEKGGASYFEALAAQRGVSGDALKPYLEQLRQAEAAQKAATKGLGTMEISAKQTAAALRGVPAQFTDIITSLQGGQAPLTVFLQQGGQLKDMFGGAGNAARALGGFVAGLVTPFTLAAAAVGGLAVAYFKGAKEGEAFNRTLILTGNAAGVTAMQLSGIAASISSFGVTQGAAAAALNQLAETGKVGADNLGRFAAAAVQLERVGGPAVEETVKAFAELGKAPLQAALKLNDTTNFLTVSLYQQIKALEEQGRATEAAKVAQEAFAAVIEDRFPKLEANLGLIERRWLAIKDAIKGAADQALNIGRPETLDELQRKLFDLQTSRSEASGNGFFTGTRRTSVVLAELDREIAAVSKKTAEMLKQQGIGDVLAQQQADTLKSVQAGNEFAKIAEQSLDKQAKLALEISRIENIGLAAGKSRAEIETQIAAARSKAADKGDATAAARALEQQAALLERLAGLSGTYAQDLQRLQAVRQRTNQSDADYVALVTELIAKQPFAVALAKQQAEAFKQVADAEDRGLDIREKYLASLNQSAASVGKQVQALKDEAEAALIAAAGQVSLAQAMEQVAIARLQERQRAAKGDDSAIAALQREIDKRRELVGLIGGKEARKAAEDASKELDKYLDPSRAESFGEALTRAFDGAGNSLARLSNSLQLYSRQQVDIGKQQALVNASNDPAKKLRAQIKINEDAQKSTIGLYAGMAGAAKGFFSEGTKGYKALEAAETAFRAYQLASDLVKGASAAAVAIASQGQGDPYTAFPRMAAMAAAMAALGFAVTGGFASGPSGGGDGAPVATGKGTVFGDANALSESISRSTDRLSETASLQLSTQSGMLASLRSIENNIGGITGLVLRGQESQGSAGERFGINEGTRTSGIGSVFGSVTPIGLVDKLLFGGRITNALFGKKTTITGNGLFADQQSLQSIIGGGLNLQDYVDVNSTKKFFGIKVSNKNSTQYSPADAQLQQQFGQVFKDIYSTILQASDPLDLAFDQVKAKLDAFVVDIGKIDLKGLTGEQISEKLAAVLGAASDNIATAAIPGLQAFQNVGEGYFETVIRVASGIETAEAALELLGVSAIKFNDIALKQGDVAAEIVRGSIAKAETVAGQVITLLGREITLPKLSSVGQIISNLDGSAEELASAYSSLVDVRDVLISIGASGESLTTAMIRGAGGLDQLQTGLSDYLDNFFTEAERTAAGRTRLQGQFDRLGLGELPQTREAFRELVTGINTSTESGQKLFAQLVGLSGAFAELVPAVESVADTTAETMRRLTQSYGDSRAQLEIELQRALGDETGARARERALQLARDSVGLSPADAEALAGLYDYNRALRDQIDAARAAVEAQKAIEAAQKSAAEAAMRAAEALQRTFDDLAGTRFDLENELLTQQGRPEDVLRRTRERDLGQLTGGLTPEDAARVAAAYDFNAALRQQIDAMVAAKTAAEQAAQAEAQRAADEQQRLAGVAQQREGLEGRLLQLQGDTAALRARELLGIDESNRAILERIFALEDEQAAASLAAQAARDLEAATKAAADAESERLRGIASERDNLVGRLLQAQGNTAAIRERELAALDASNRFILEQIFALEDQRAANEAATQAAQEAARAAEQLRSAWQSVTDTIFDEVKRIRDLMGGDSAQSLASAQAQFAITTAQARAGDQEAAKLLPSLSQTLLQLAEQSATSLLDVERIRAQVAASLEQTGGSLVARFGLSAPRLSTGTNYVPQDMLAVIHKGEAVVPRQFNPAASGAAGGKDRAAASIDAMREENKAQALAIVKLQTEIAKLLRKWDGEGVPEERSVAA
ncbi:MAG: phage tail length tape measure family protein [Roseateles sp.]|uniref:phage tail length tape measure family protein n=1 Tax=Roseateles sp. TaxID=1971397 RepID=UPI004036A66C